MMSVSVLKRNVTLCFSFAALMQGVAAVVVVVIVAFIHYGNIVLLLLFRYCIFVWGFFRAHTCIIFASAVYQLLLIRPVCLTHPPIKYIYSVSHGLRRQRRLKCNLSVKFETV